MVFLAVRPTPNPTLTPPTLQERDARAAMEQEMKAAQDQKSAAEAAAAAKADALRERQRTSIATPGSARPGTGRRKFGL